MIPGKHPSVEEQRRWITKINRLVKQAENKEIVLLFADPTHPTHNSENGKRWQAQGKSHTIVIPSNSGRKRLTILGALNPLTMRPTILLTEDNCDTRMTEAFLGEVRKDYSDMKIPVVVILDNARYNHGAQKKAHELNIILKFLPPYSPNLNLIERLWKFYKKKVKKDKYHATFKEFFDATIAFFQNITDYRTELESLLTLKFEIIK